MLATASSIGMSNSASSTENSPTVNDSLLFGVAALLGDQLAEARARERRDRQLGRLVVDTREQRQRRPRPQALEPEQCERVRDRAHRLAQPEEGGVDVAQQPHAEPDVERDPRLQILELDARVLEDREQVEHRQPAGVDPLGLHDLRPAEEVALEQIAPRLLADGVVALVLDPLGERASDRSA